jgi:hypothetical protein
MKWLAISAAIIAVAVVTYKVNYPTYSYRYRLQISLSIDEKVHTGSSVIEVVWGCGPKVADSGRCGASLRGQAAVIDLGSRGAVVATLRTGDSVSPTPEGAISAIFLCANAFGNHSTDEELPALPRLTGRRDLSPSNFPRLVWFSNPAEPKSAKKITVEDVAKVIDPTARFTEAFVEITRDPVVMDIASKLPWFQAWSDNYRARGPIYFPNGFALSRYMFVGDAS